MTVVEWPGTGDAPPVSDPSVTTMVEFASGYVDADTVLFGQSMNALLVLAVAAATNCRGVIAVTPPHPGLNGDVMKAYWDAHAEPERKARAAAIRAEVDASGAEATPMHHARWQTLRYFYDVDHAVPAPEEWVVPGDWVGPVFASFADVDWPATLHTAVPVLLTLGAYDFVAAPQPWLDEPARAGWTVELFERSGHAPFMDQPDEFVAAVERWLKTI
jgi:pimeloyl-ACP methyl ester carboxylesterase